MAGNPNPRGSKPDKLIRDALMIALKREAADSDGKVTTKLAVIADAIVTKAMAGDIQAAALVADRVDGKAPQALEHSGEIEHAYVARLPTASKTMDEWQASHANSLNPKTLQ